jgi:hypothetical protein
MSKNAETAIPLKWPDNITAAGFKAHSNFFIGADDTALFKTMLSIRTMVGVGMVLALVLPTKIMVFVAAAMTLPQLILTLARHYRIIEDPVKTAHPIIRGRYAAEIEGDFCVFHVGLIVNSQIPTMDLKKIGDAFSAMVAELEADPERYGFYGATNYIAGNASVDSTLTIQYWRSQQHVDAYARDHMTKHFPNMLWTSKMMKLSADVGFWHESFTVHAGEYEGVYVNCPQMLLGKAGRVVPATGRRRTARGRLAVTDGKDLDHLDMPESY